MHDETNQIIVGGFDHNFSFNDFSTNYIVGVAFFGQDCTIVTKTIVFDYFP